MEVVAPTVGEAVEEEEALMQGEGEAVEEGHTERSRAGGHQSPHLHRRDRSDLYHQIYPDRR